MDKPHLLFISPHLDDIVFSLGDYISKLAQPIIIATIFTKKNNDKLKTFKGDYYLYADYETRIDEDILAMNKLNMIRLNMNKIYGNIIIEYFNLEDKIFRNMHYNDSILETKIIDKINILLTQYNISHIYLPTAIGYHADHIIAFNINKYLKTKKILYYFDYPYCTMRFNKIIRLSDFGVFNTLITPNDIYMYYINPINISCNPVLRCLKIVIYLFRYITNSLFKKRQHINKILINKCNIQTKFELMLNYKSQIKPIFGNKNILNNVLIGCPDEKIIIF